MRARTPVATVILALVIRASVAHSSHHHHHSHESSPPPSGVQLSGAAAESQVHYVRGIALYDSDQYQQAMDEFRRAVEIYASPNPQLYVARSFREMGRLVDAEREYQRTVSMASERAASEPRYAATRDAAVEELRAVDERVGHVRIDPNHVPEGAHVRVGGTEVSREALAQPVAVEPGSVDVDVESPGFQTAHDHVSVAAGQQAALGVNLAADNAPLPWTRTLAFGALGLGAVGVIGTVAFFAAAAGQYSSLASQCGNAPCPANDSGAISDGRTFQALGDVSLALAILGVAGGAALFVLSPSRPHSSVVRLGVAGPQLVVTGEF